VPEKYISTVVWSCNRPNLAENVRRVVADVPGFMFLKSRFEDESTNSEVDESVHVGIKDEVYGQRSSDTSVNFGNKSLVSSSSNVIVDFRPDMPYNGANKIAFESNFMNIQNRGTEKRLSSANSKPKKQKTSMKEKVGVTQKYKKYSRKSPRTSKKKTTKRVGSTKRKYTKSKKGSIKNSRRR